MEKPSEPLGPDELLEPVPHVTGRSEGSPTGSPPRPIEPGSTDIAEGQPLGGPRLELTWQAIVVAFLVAAIVSASYPYVVLKLGMGPNISVVSAFLGAVLLMALAKKTHGRNRLMNNIVQTAGTSAAGTAFMCIVAAAVQLAAENPAAQERMDGIKAVEPWPMFLWLFTAGSIGVLFTVLFRRHFLDDPKMIFADGVAAAETIVVLDSRGPEAGTKLRLLGVCSLLSAGVDAVREIFEWLHDYFFSPMARSLKVGIEWNLLSIGTGLLIGLNVSLSMLAATIVVWITGPMLLDAGIGKEIVLNGIIKENRPKAAVLIDKKWVHLETDEEKKFAKENQRWPEKYQTAENLTREEQDWVVKHGGRQADYMQEKYFGVLLIWYMWPATALMIVAAITAVLLKWRTIVESFTHLRMQAKLGKSEDVSMTTIIGGSVLMTAILVYVQHEYFGLSYLQTIVAVLCSLPLILVGIRVLGETNNGPVSVMMNGLQAVFAVFWSSHIGHNLIAAGVAGSCNAQGQGTIQDYKTGKIIGSSPRILTWVQLAAVPIGAAAVAIMYPILTSRYKLGEDLTTPTGVKIAGMAILLSQGIGAFPQGALLWTVIGAVVGILTTIIIHFWKIDWLPSAAGFGFGLILPGTLNIPIAIGGIGGWLWLRSHKPSFDRFAVTVASGFIAGEALLGGLVLPVIGFLRQ
jgi:uncharacterized oligopeptide transporter (OPT) family protein